MRWRGSLDEKRAAYRSCFDTPNGRTVLEDLYAFCHAANPTYVRGDPHQTAFNEGQRRVFLRIFGFLNREPSKMSNLEELENE